MSPALSSRRKPWPYDVRIALRPPPRTPDRTVGSFRGNTIGSQRGTLIGSTRGGTNPFSNASGFMLVPQQGGLLIGKKQTNLIPTYPQTADYGSAPVYRERTFMFRPTGGMGEAVQSSGTDRRYHYALDCWVMGGYFGKGPRLHPVVPSATDGAVRRFAEGRYAGAERLFVLDGSRVLVSLSDDPGGQVVAIQRAGHVATDVARFQGAYAGAVDALYIAWDDGVLQQYDGTTVTACALPAGFAPSLLEVVGNELWAADAAAAVIRKVEADPKVATNWDGPIPIGTPSTRITAIRQTTNRLAIFKDDGDVFTINGDGSDNDLFPGLGTTRDPDTARTAWQWLGSLWFRAGGAFYKLDLQGGAQLSPAGPERMLGNHGPVRGPVQAFCGWNEQLAFAVIHNPEDATSYLLSYGNWLPQSGESGTRYEFTDQYDGAIAHWPGRRATALWINTTTGQDRLYVGFADGGYDWLKLVPFPFAASSGAEFKDGTALMVLPLHHAMFQADKKHTVGFSAFGPRFAPGDRVTVSYRLAGSSGLAPATPTGDFMPLPDPLTSNGARIEVMRPLVATAIELELTIDAVQTNWTPVLEGIGVHERLVPTFRRDFGMTLNANDAVARRDGSVMRQNGAQLRDLLLQAAEMPGLVSVELPDERIYNVALFDYQERITPHSVRGGLGAQVDVQLTEFRITEVYGVIRRFRGTTIGEWRGFSIGTMRYM
ncbi:MAG TPA: hypothetical protein VGJ60_16510 [Chloroflexota bacterium]